MKKKEGNDVIFYAYNLTEVCDYLKKKCNGLKMVSSGGRGGYDNIASIKYEGCSFSVNAGEEIHISIFYDHFALNIHKKSSLNLNGMTRNPILL